MSNVIIRPYKTSDRFTVRKICADTADKGEPVENFFPDRESITDLLCGYYTDYEPEGLFVAESGSRVVGYVMGCFDNRRYGLAMTFIVIPVSLVKAFKNGVFFKKQVWQVIGGMLYNWPRLFAWRKRSFHSHEGHLHIGIDARFRHQHIGSQLVDAILSFAKANQIEVLAASVHDGNKSAAAFFERQGFVVSERYPMVMNLNGQLTNYHSLSYVKKI